MPQNKIIHSWIPLNYVRKLSKKLIFWLSSAQFCSYCVRDRWMTTVFVFTFWICRRRVGWLVLKTTQERRKCSLPISPDLCECRIVVSAKRSRQDLESWSTVFGCLWFYFMFLCLCISIQMRFKVGLGPTVTIRAATTSSYDKIIL